MQKLGLRFPQGAAGLFPGPVHARPHVSLLNMGVFREFRDLLLLKVDDRIPQRAIKEDGKTHVLRRQAPGERLRLPSRPHSSQPVVFSED